MPLFATAKKMPLRHIVEGKGRLLVVQKTGWGKSFAYFIATKSLREAGAGPALLISPLLALMRNQIAAAERMGGRAATINSDNMDDWTAVEGKLAKNIRAARQRGEEQGLSEVEIAFYDALAENESAIQMLGDDKLKLIAHELLVSLRENVSVDWAHRDSARARMRVLVKRILRKYGYPPDLQDATVQTMLQQAEALSSGWSAFRSASGGGNG